MTIVMVQLFFLLTQNLRGELIFILKADMLAILMTIS